MNRFDAYRPALRRPLALLWLLAACVGASAQTAPTAPAPASAAAGSAAGPTVRPDIGKLLVAAQDLVRAKSGKLALDRLAEAEAVPALTPYEHYHVERLKSMAALDAGDQVLATAALERTLGSEFLPAADRLPFIDVLARLAIQAKDYPRAAQWLGRYKDAGGADPLLRRVLPQLLAELGDHAGAVREGLALAQADEAAGRASAESLLRNLAFSQNKLGDTAAYVGTLERLAQQHPKTEYWSELISRAERRPGFNGERLRLDVYRLLRATGVELSADELADMAQRAHQFGLPAEAQALLDEGIAAGALGKGKDGAAHLKLRDQAHKAAAQDSATLAESERSALAGKDGNALVSLGFALSGAGMHDKALGLTEQGIAKGGLRRPDEAQLHLGVAQWRAGRMEDAARSFAAVKGIEGSAELARIWALFVASGKKR